MELRQIQDSLQRLQQRKSDLLGLKSIADICGISETAITSLDLPESDTAVDDTVAWKKSTILTWLLVNLRSIVKELTKVLRPCPFCNSKNPISGTRGNGWEGEYVICQDCGVEMEASGNGTNMSNEKLSAKMKWNRRGGDWK